MRCKHGISKGSYCEACFIAEYKDLVTIEIIVGLILAAIFIGIGMNYG